MVEQPSRLGAGNISNSIDRWIARKNSATGTVLIAQSPGPGPGPVIVPGTSFAISQSWLALKVGTQQATLAAGEYVMVYQAVEGPMFRELSKDVSSISLLVYSQAAITIAVNLLDSVGGYSIAYPASIPANQLTLVTLPNIPLWPSGGTFPTASRIIWDILSAFVWVVDRRLCVRHKDAWVNGSYLGLANTTNFLSLPTNTLVWLGFVQHEPGPLCSTLMDKPFSQNYDECLRYYQKTYPYGTIAGTVTSQGARAFIALAAQAAVYGAASFHKPMAKIPTVTLYNHSTGAINSVRDGGGADHTGAAAATLGDSGFYNVSFTGATGGATQVYFHYAADTGW